MTLNIEDFVEAAEQDGLEASDIPPAVQERLNNALADLTGGDNPTAGGDDAELANLVVSAANGNDDDGSSPFATIGAALDAASADDVIFVEPGTYGQSTDSISVDKSVTLASSDGPDGTTVESQIVVSADDATLDGLTVSPPDATCNPVGEAVLITESDVTVQNMTVEDFDAATTLDEDIGGIVAFGSSSTPVSGVTIQNNLVTDIRGPSSYGSVGISAQGNANNITVTDNTVTNIGLGESSYAFGSVVRGSGSADSTPSNVDINNNDISAIQANTPDDDDGTVYKGVGLGVEAAESAISIENNDVDDVGIGVEIKDAAGETTLENNTFTRTDIHLGDTTGSVTLTDDTDSTGVLGANDFGEAAATANVESGSFSPSYVKAILTSISEAVAESSTGAQIDVAPGTYNEAVDITTEGLTLKGPNASVSYDGTRAEEAEIRPGQNTDAFQVGADNVEVSGFDIQIDADSMGPNALYVTSNDDTVGGTATVRNNIVSATGNVDEGINGIFVPAASDGPGAPNTVLIEGNEFDLSAAGDGNACVNFTFNSDIQDEIVLSGNKLVGDPGALKEADSLTVSDNVFEIGDPDGLQYGTSLDLAGINSGSIGTTVSNEFNRAGAGSGDPVIDDEDEDFNLSTVLGNNNFESGAGIDGATITFD